MKKYIITARNHSDKLVYLTSECKWSVSGQFAHEFSSKKDAKVAEKLAGMDTNVQFNTIIAHLKP